MEKYRADWKNGIIFGIGLALWIFFAFLNTQSLHVFTIASVAMSVLIISVALLITRFSYISTNGTSLRFVYLLYSRRVIDIASITEITDQQTYKVGKRLFRSLYIYYNDAHSQNNWIEIRIGIFPERVLGKLIRNLKKRNPRIQLSNYSLKLAGLEGRQDQQNATS